MSIHNIRACCKNYGHAIMILGMLWRLYEYFVGIMGHATGIVCACYMNCGHIIEIMGMM